MIRVSKTQTELETSETKT